MGLIRGMRRFTEAVVQQPAALLAWLGLLVLVNGVLPLAFIQTLEGKVVLAVFALGGMLMAMITDRVGYTRLLGMGHFPWFGLLPWVYLRLPAHPADGAVGLWLRALLVLNGISLLIDVIDVVRYARGEREPTA